MVLAIYKKLKAPLKSGGRKWLPASFPNCQGPGPSPGKGEDGEIINSCNVPGAVVGILPTYFIGNLAGNLE